MDITEVGIQGLLVIQPRVFKDDRGYFFESYQRDILKHAGVIYDFLQDNESCSLKGVLRGLHLQAPPFDQGKLVRVVAGKVLDVAVDVRRGSTTYGKYFSIELSGDNKTIFWIPPGFAHGFVALEDNTIFSYKCTNVYNKGSEHCIRWNDPHLNINWGYKDPLVSTKDQEGVSFETFISPFN